MLSYRFLAALLSLGGLFVTTLSPCSLQAQPTYQRPVVIEKKSEYNSLVRKDPDQALIELRTVIENPVYDLRYATSQNFTGQPLYPLGTRFCYLRKPAAEALSRVAASLRKKGWGLKIFDAYRPFGVTELFWELIGDERYVANPAKGSGHNRGIAVDLTLVQASSGTELDMGTGFDHFSDTAHHSFRSLPSKVLENRTLLRNTMEKHGFKFYEEEWWHYSWPEPTRYELLDIPFNRLKRLSR